MEVFLTKFEKKVIEKLKKIPRGKVTTYGFLARAVGKPKAARAIGNVVGKNPFAPKVPCHRVVKSDGSIGGYSGKGGAKRKVQLLKKEGVLVKKGKIVDFSEKLFKF